MKQITIYLLAALVAVFTTHNIQAQNAQDYPAEFIFKLGITYEMTSGKPGDTQKTMETTFWFSDQNYSGFNMGGQLGMMMVFDLPRNQLLSFIESQKMVMIMDLKKMQNKADSMNKAHNGDTSRNDVKIRKTGKTEKILGYTCEQYQVTSKNTNMQIWLTKELGVSYAGFSKSFPMMMRANRSGNSTPDLKDAANSVMLRMETTSLESGATSKLEAKSIQKEGKTFPTAGYKKISMPGME
ncbi:DUF4412 domain-containing protein [Flavihumibacter profundi]|uniref:DUF4412 domain-containing protein n=1 Tax=Flavihumibacter profundi TaxID=2716883 RepID=UPI001CC73197|nr:DUF4412 domain-containing protein [Flavihumibacter profundi]MBZ5857661.1 DUF4412 domain-containing protein [Flavihumibacter profundi]